MFCNVCSSLWLVTTICCLLTLSNACPSSPNDNDEISSGPEENNVPNMKIGSFNLKIFGATKLKSQNVVNSIIDIITRYDIIASKRKKFLLNILKVYLN